MDQLACLSLAFKEELSTIGWHTQRKSFVVYKHFQVIIRKVVIVFTTFRTHEKHARNLWLLYPLGKARCRRRKNTVHKMAPFLLLLCPTDFIVRTSAHSPPVAVPARFPDLPNAR